ncbi:MAG: aldo/keto reductase [Myxococcales bacterium]|nr:aldo/keto reductase [Myxococcales bacterium]
MSAPQLFGRRWFLELAGVAALGACRRKSPADQGPDATARKEGATPLSPPSTAAVPRRMLGKTGVEVSIVGLGGYHLGLATDEAEATRLIRTALDRGVDFMDNCWDYHDGKSEEWMGKALADGYRGKAFVMTKIDGRTKRAAAQQLEQSLRRLRTETIDLVQIHEVIRDSDPARCFADGGAIEALVDARRAGKLRFIGFTGHKDPSIHLAMLEAADAHGFAFDTVQMPLNVLDAHFRSFEQRVLPVLVRKGIGVLGMKPMAAGKLLATKAVTAVECLHYAMSLPTSVVITGCESMATVEQAIEAAVTSKPMQPGERSALLERTRELAQGGRLERFKTSQDFDGTTWHPEWLEAASS